MTNPPQRQRGGVMSAIQLFLNSHPRVPDGRIGGFKTVDSDVSDSPIHVRHSQDPDRAVCHYINNSLPGVVAGLPCDCPLPYGNDAHA